MKVLASPSKVAKNLNLGAGSVLSLNIHRDRICMSVGSYDNVKKLAPISIDRVKEDNGGIKLLNEIVDEYNVCGFVVAWPVQKDTGKWGAPCGRVLYALEKLIGNSANKIFTRERPLCFWDSFRANNQRKPVDEIGRCASYGEPSNKSLHVASEEQYNHDIEVTSTDIWNDFCTVHLPQVSKRTARKLKDQKSQSHNLVSDWGDRKTFSNAFAC